MERFVYYSKLKLIASLAPLFLVVAVLFWLGTKSSLGLILGGSMALVTAALILKLSPFDRPKLEVGNTAVLFGKNLETQVPLRNIKYAISGGSTPNAWPGAVSVYLEMESRLEKGQRYFDRVTIQLFCIDTTTDDIAEHINSRIHALSRDDG